MADNNNMLTIVLVVAAVLLFSGNLTGNVGRQVPAGSQVDSWVEASNGKALAEGQYVAYQVGNGNIRIDRNVGGVLTSELCSDTGVINNRYGVNRQYTTDPISTDCIPISVSNTLSPESY